MNALWVFAIAIGVVAGDVGLGYHYKVPQTSYGVPTYQGSSSSGNSGTFNSGLSGSSSQSSNYNSQYAGSVGTGSNYYTGQSGSQGGLSSTSGQNTGYLTGFQTTGGTAGTGASNNYYQTTGTSAGTGANNNYFQTTGSSAGTGGSSNYYQTSGFGQPTYQTGGDYSAINQYETSNQYQASAVEKYQQYYNVIQQQPAQVFKHYYVHAAPEEPEIPKSPKPVVLPPAQKHYKIIFIKAPAAQAQAPQIVPVQQQNEEKTIVYVLVQKPEDAQNIVLPKIEQKPPTKPEVYFIKYNNKHDSQAVINNIVSDLNKGGSVDSGYSGLTDGSNVYSTSNQGSVSSGQVFGQALSSSEDQGSSSFDSSSIGSSSNLGSSTFGSGSSDSSGQVFGSGTSGSSIFGSGSSGSTAFGSGSSSGTFGSSSGSNAFGSSLSGSENYGSSTGTFGSTGTLGSSSNVFGSSYEGSKEQSLSVSTIDSGISDNGYDSSSGLTSVSSTVGPLPDYEASAISTSQGVPHETYGVPKFKVV